MDFGRPSTDFRRSPDFGGRRDFRLEPQHRSRSQTRVDPDFIPDYSPYSRPIDKNSRSRSLDYRDAFRDDDPYFEERRPGGVTIPIRQERPDRNYDYDRERNWVDTPRGREIEIPMERLGKPARSTEIIDRRQPPFDDRRLPPPQRQSPKSVASSRKQQNLNLSFDATRNRRIEPPPMDYRRGDDYGTRRDTSRDNYRGEWAAGERREGGSRGAQGGRYERSWHYESHGGAGGATSGGISPRRAIQQQPVHNLSPPMYGAPSGPAGPNGFGPRPVQYRKIKCCCFTFIWPPWSTEPANPPQQIYRNI